MTSTPPAPREIWREFHWAFFIDVQGLILALRRFALTLERGVIAAAGRASCNPPPAPRVERSSPAAESLLTSFCTVGTGNPVSAASSDALVLAPPQWRAAALIVTMA